jgi:hypothetical protein
MRFALLCYASESIQWTKEQGEAVMAKHDATDARLAEEGKLGPNLRLMPTSTAMTICGGPEPQVLDGPFAETKEQLLGLWILECASLEEAVGIARELASHSPGGRLELRPIAQYDPGVLD